MRYILLALWVGAVMGGTTYFLLTPAAAPPPARRHLIAAPKATPPPQPRKIGLPISGLHAVDIQDTFALKRDRTRQHEAVDILAPRGTQSMPVVDGVVKKLFLK